MSPPTVEPNAGFSLVETLVSLFVIALVSTSAGALLIDTLNASERVDAAAERVRQMEVASGFLRADLAAMTSRASRGPSSLDLPSGPEGTDGTQDGVVLSFVRGGWGIYGNPSPLRSDLARIEYVRDGNTLVRRFYSAPDPIDTTEYVEHVLFDGLTDLSVRYYAAGGWSQVWDTPQGDASPLLPALVEITVTEPGDRVVRIVSIAGAL